MKEKIKKKVTVSDHNFDSQNGGECFHYYYYYFFQDIIFFCLQNCSVVHGDPPGSGDPSKQKRGREIKKFYRRSNKLKNQLKVSDKWKMSSERSSSPDSRSQAEQEACCRIQASLALQALRRQKKENDELKCNVRTLSEKVNCRRPCVIRTCCSFPVRLGANGRTSRQGRSILERNQMLYDRLTCRRSLHPYKASLLPKIKEIRIGLWSDHPPLPPRPRINLFIPCPIRLSARENSRNVPWPTRIVSFCPQAFANLSVTETSGSRLII